jgi:hypothetical protein
MKHADSLAVGGFQLVAFEALMLPDGLKQFFRRHRPAVVQCVDGAALFAPGGVEIFGAGIHAAVFCAAGGKVKLANLLVVS